MTHSLAQLHPVAAQDEIAPRYGRGEAFWVAADGTVTTGMQVNDWDAIGAIRTIVEQGALTAGSGTHAAQVACRSPRHRR